MSRNGIGRVVPSLVLAAVVLAGLMASSGRASQGVSALRVERITTIVPFPRGLVLLDDELVVLSRGRVRDSGGVTAEVDDQAGTLFVVDPAISEPVSSPTVSEAVRSNGRILARPTDPPFKLWDRAADPPESDRRTDRPYCTLRFHEPTQSFYLCAFAGIDLGAPVDGEVFSKNASDAVLRYDLRTRVWYEIERHDRASHDYPHHDPAVNDPPHGWLKGPNNALVVGDWLYVVAKDNSLLVRYDLSRWIDDPEAPPPGGEVVMDHAVQVRGLGPREYHGQSALAWREGYLYIAYRTASVILRIAMDESGEPARPLEAELLAKFTPWDPKTRATTDLTDMDFDAAGRLYVVSAKPPARIFRFTPDPDQVFDARDGGAPAWVELGEVTGNPRIKAENILLDEQGRAYITTGDGYSYQAGADGTVYRITEMPAD